MQNYLPLYKTWLSCFLFLGWNAYILSAQLLPRQPIEIDLIAEITPQFKKAKDDGPIIFKPTREMDDILNFAQTNVDPFKRNLKTDQFLNRYLPYSDTRLMKNGDIAYLDFYHDKYLITLKECLNIANPYGLKFGTTRREFFKTSALETRKEKRQYWRKFNNKRNELVAKFIAYREHIIPAVSTEVAMILQEDHFPELTLSMNELNNLDGSPLQITIYSNRVLSIPGKKNTTIAGLSIISKCEDTFTSGSPAVRNAFPGLRGSNKGLTVHLRLFENGVTLSHELGHLYYLAYKWEEYVAYIHQKGKDYEPGGHGPGDPSGLAARMTENGKMPF